MGHAAAVLINEQFQAGIAVPSTSFLNSDGVSTTVVISADDSVVAAAHSKSVLHGAYHNVITVEGVSALWNGVISAAPASVATAHRHAVPAVVAGGMAALPLRPHNLAQPAKHIVFYEKGAQKGALSVEEATKRLLALTDASKENVVKEILKSAASISVAGSAIDVIV